MNGAPSAEVHGDRSAHVEVPYPEGESWRQATDRNGRVLMDLPTRWDGRKILVVGHMATIWALERFLGGHELQDLVSAEFLWQEGWEYGLALPGRGHSPLIWAGPGVLTSEFSWRR
jgi:broad specificity phosphatase PhoE